MKIAMISSLYAPHVVGGAEVLVQRLSEMLAEVGHEVSVLTTHDSRETAEDWLSGVRVIRLPYQNILWNSGRSSAPAWKRSLWHFNDIYNRKMKRLVQDQLKSLRPDLVCAYNLPGFSASVWAAAHEMKIPLVQVLQDYYSICPKSTMFAKEENCEQQCGVCRWMRRKHQGYSNLVEAVVGGSHAVLRRHLDFGLFADVKHKRVIHNSRYVPPVVQRPSRPGTGVRFGYIGTIAPNKGVELLAASFAKVVANGGGDHRLLIAGTGRSDYVAQLREKWEGPAIEFIGRADPFEFFPSIDVAVVPSLWREPFGIVCLEALGCDVPVIASNLGGLPEIVQHEENGLLFDPHHPPSLVAAISRMVGDAAFRQRMARQARASVHTFLDADHWLNEHLALFEEVSGKKRAASGSVVRTDVDAPLDSLVP